MSETQNIWDNRGQVDLAALVRRLWLGRWWLVVSIVIVTALFLTAAFTMNPAYRAQALLAPASIDRSGASGGIGSLGSLGGLAALAGLNLGANGSATEEALAVLRSREFTEKFITANQLMPKLFREQWDPVARAWISPEASRPTLARAFRLFDKTIREAELDKRSGLVTLKIEWRDPAEAAFWVNDLIVRLNAEMRARAMRDSNAAVGYLEKELAATSTIETRLAIGRLMEAQINQRMLASVTQEYAFRVVDKALPPDPRDRVRPNKPLMAALGVMFGFTLGAVIVLLFGIGTNRRQPQPSRETNQ